MRLIDADLLLEELNSFSMRITGSANAMIVMDETKKSIAKIIEDQPTAYDYDVDKVMKQLEEYAHSNICSSHNGCPYKKDDNMTCENCGAIGALEIVKSGMKE